MEVIRVLGRIKDKLIPPQPPSREPNYWGLTEEEVLRRGVEVELSPRTDWPRRAFTPEELEDIVTKLSDAYLDTPTWDQEELIRSTGIVPPWHGWGLNIDPKLQDAIESPHKYAPKRKTKKNR